MIITYNSHKCATLFPYIDYTEFDIGILLNNRFVPKSHVIMKIFDS